jgi:hypothetical protein
MDFDSVLFKQWSMETQILSYMLSEAQTNEHHETIKCVCAKCVEYE